MVKQIVRSFVTLSKAEHGVGFQLKSRLKSHFKLGAVCAINIQLPA